MQKSSDKDLARTWLGTFVPFSPRLCALAGVLLIVAAAVIIYFPSLSGGFIWDDSSIYITNNQIIKSSDGLYRFWCISKELDYYPVSNSTFWIEWRLWGMNPTGYHVTNLIFHIVSTLLIWYILQKLSMPGAFLAALIFAVHPVNVESVAWIAQRKNLMAMVFFLLTILCYLKAETQPPPRKPLYWPGIGFWYRLSLVAFMLGILSKGSVVVLPVLLLGIVWWIRDVTKWDMVGIAPFFVAAVIFTGLNVWTHSSSTEVIRNVSFVERLLGAGGVIWFYLYKAILPLNLMFVYPQWNIRAGNLAWWLPLLAVLIVTAVLWWYRKSWSRPLLFAWGFFCVALAPVMGLADIYFMKFSLVADHYQHIAIIGVIVLVSTGFSTWRQRLQGVVHCAATVIAIIAVGTLAFLTWRQSGIYCNEITLFRDTLQKNPDCWMAHNNLGYALAQTGRPREALEHYQQALRLEPNIAEFHNNLGNALKDLGRLPEAIEQYRLALKLDPQFAEIYNNLGIALAEAGQWPDAIEQYRQALRLKPYDAEIITNLGVALSNVGRLSEAIKHYQKAVILNPNHVLAHNNLGYALCLKGREQEAIKHFEQSLILKPNDPDVHINLGNALRATNQLKEALEHYRQALKLRPNYAEAYNCLGAALAQAGRSEEAIDHYRQALKFKPDYAEAHNNLGDVFSELGRWREAIEQYQQALDFNLNLPQIHNNMGIAYRAIGQHRKAIEHFQQAVLLKPDYLAAYNNLAFTYAQTNQSAEAVAAAQKALDLARSKGQTAQAKQIEDWLDSHRAGLPDPKSASPPGEPVSPQP